MTIAVGKRLVDFLIDIIATYPVQTTTKSLNTRQDHFSPKNTVITGVFRRPPTDPSLATQMSLREKTFKTQFSTFA